jgi:hypothetical protein
MEQLVILVLIGLISFIQWLIKQSAELREKKKQAERAAMGGEKLRQHPEPSEPVAPRETVSGDEAMRRLMEALGLPPENEPPVVVSQPEPPVQPPPLPMPVIREVPVFREAVPVFRPDPPPPRQVRRAQPAPSEAADRFPEFASAATLRRAIILREILGPPRALDFPAR